MDSFEHISQQVCYSLDHTSPLKFLLKELKKGYSHGGALCQFEVL
jgi:hypothetical protein